MVLPQAQANTVTYTQSGTYTDAVTGWGDQELSDLIARSHELVAAGLTKKVRLELGLL